LFFQIPDGFPAALCLHHFKTGQGASITFEVMAKDFFVVIFEK